MRDPLREDETGKLLETYLLQEIRASMAYHQSGGQLFYWRSGSELEVDFVWQRADLTVGIEVKSATRWRQEDGRGLRSLLRANALSRAIGVYRGNTRLRVGEIDVWPADELLRQLGERGLPEIAIGD